MIEQYSITLPAMPRGFHVIDTYILKELQKLPKIGIIHIFIKHTSAALAINEAADPNVLTDLKTIFNKPATHEFF